MGSAGGEGVTEGRVQRWSIVGRLKEKKTIDQNVCLKSEDVRQHFFRRRSRRPLRLVQIITHELPKPRPWRGLLLAFFEECCYCCFKSPLCFFAQLHTGFRMRASPTDGPTILFCIAWYPYPLLA